MSSLLFRICRFFLFLLPAERSHDLGLKALGLLHRCGLSSLLRPRLPTCPVRVLGLDFPNPVGLAAGLDKNADYLDALGALGFGFIEVGTVTPKPQPGNPQPRLFRLTHERALINRMGFNNKGVEHLVAQLQQRRYRGIVGVNIGKNLGTPVERAVEDYLYCLRRVYPLADYVVVNLSSPNTPGLRKLQFGEHLEELLQQLGAAKGALAAEHQRQVPLLVKIAPDLTSDEIAAIAAALGRHPIDGVIATNTTLSRVGVEQSPLAGETGGLSGAPLTLAAEQVQTSLCTALAGTLPVIAVGGIMQGSDAARRLASGASLVQLYTGFIYRGPALLRDAVLACAAQLR